VKLEAHRALGGPNRSLPLRTDRSTLEFSGILKMKENSNETITVHGNPDHLDTGRGEENCGFLSAQRFTAVHSNSKAAPNAKPSAPNALLAG